MAVSFLTITKRSATFLRNIESFVFSELRDPPAGVPILGTAFTASFLVILPSFPVPVTAVEAIPFSANTFLAAGEALPLAYDFSTTTGAGFSTLGASVLTSAAFGAAVPSGFLPSISIKQTTDPTATASPSSAFKEIIPLSSAGNSNVALSESTSAIG